MKTLILAFLILVSSLTNAQVQIISKKGWTYPGPTLCDAENFQLLNFGILNNTDSILEIYSFDLLVEDSLSILDSIYVFTQDQKLLSRISSTSIGFSNLNLFLDSKEYTDFYLNIKTKIGEKGKFKISVKNFVYKNGSKIFTDTSTKASEICNVENYAPIFDLRTVLYKENSVTNFCSSDTVFIFTIDKSMHADVYFIDKWEWYQDGVLINKEYSSLVVKNLKKTSTFLVKATDILGRMWVDSITIKVLDSPVLKLSVVDTGSCRCVNLNLDTTSLSGWSWSKTGSMKDNPASFFNACPYKEIPLRIEALNGCMKKVTLYITPYFVAY